ncbi:MAG: NUDIX hydrolase [Candidatus Binataceae bacterium]
MPVESQRSPIPAKAEFDRQVGILRLKLSAAAPAPRSVLANNAGAAAVLVPIAERAGATHLVYIRRSEHVTTHRGQIAFPGGRLDAADATPLDAALREANEEVGLHPSSVEVLGALPTMRTVTGGIVVAPFAGVIRSNAPLRANPAEVAEIFDVPFSALRDPRFRGDYEWTGGGRTGKFPAILYEGRTIWGLTYRITLDLIELLAGSAP